MAIKLRSLQSRIVILFMALIIVVQLIGFIATQASISQNSRVAVQAQLEVGERIFHRLLKQNAENLGQGASLLATDFGFRQALATNDQPTIVSALANHRARIGANVALLYGADGKRRGADSDVPLTLGERQLDELVAAANKDGSANAIGVLDNIPYQLVVVPIKAPLTIGWVVMGFVIDNALTKELNALSTLEVSFLATDANGHWRAVASTLDNAAAAQLVDALGGHERDTAWLSGNREFNLEGIRYGTRLVPISESNQRQTVIAVLQRSIDEAVAQYRQLQLNLLILTVLSLLAFVAGSIATARRITRPVSQLAESAKRFGAGDYSAPIAPMQDDEIGDLGRAIDHMRDDIAQRETRIRTLAYCDELTKLPNRASFMEMLQKGVSNTAQTGLPCSVLMMDLDRFKHVNDALGHAMGDLLLQRTAQRIANACKQNADAVARLGGDEFAVLLPGVGPETALQIAERILHALELPIALNDQIVDISAGIGIASCPDHAGDAQTLLIRAEIAMYFAKSRSAGALVYDPAYDGTSQENLSLMSELRHAIENDELLLYVQPKIELPTGQVTGIEALVRWIHPQRGFMPPDSFIPYAEQTGVVRAITMWMLQATATSAAGWRQQGIEVNCAVNLSARDLLDIDLPTKIDAIFKKSEVPPTAFCLEITESTIMEDPARAQLTVERLHAMGVRLAIDDFGTGYSSLAYIKRLPVDELKIDKSFVMNMTHQDGDATIVRSTIDLGHNMGMKVIAEGIESRQIWDQLAAMGCDYGQGYFMSKPMPAAEFPAWLANWSAHSVSVRTRTPPAIMGSES